jgi:hypothetical protein
MKRRGREKCDCKETFQVTRWGKKGVVSGLQRGYKDFFHCHAISD